MFQTASASKRISASSMPIGNPAFVVSPTPLCKDIEEDVAVDASGVDTIDRRNATKNKDLSPDSSAIGEKACV